jgi:hypothetical protein
MNQEQKERIYALECDLYPEIAANNKLIDALAADLKKLQNGAVGIAKQTERKKKQRLKQGKEKLLSHYTMEKDGVKNRLGFSLKKIEDDSAVFLAKKESEKRRIDAEIEAYTIKVEGMKKRLTDEYDAKIENYYSPHIAALYEDGSENCSEDEIQPTYSPTYYAKKAQMDELIEKNKSTQRVIDAGKETILGNTFVATPSTPVKKSAADEAFWAEADRALAARAKERADSLALHRSQIDAKQRAEWAAMEKKLKEARDAAMSDDLCQTMRVI